MPLFRIHRMKDGPRGHFRWAPHTSGTTSLRAKDFEPAGFVDASGFYSAWAALKDVGEPLRVGDVLEDETGELRVCKYVGFEEAQWELAESQPPVFAVPAAASVA